MGVASTRPRLTFGLTFNPVANNGPLYLWAIVGFISLLAVCATSPLVNYFTGQSMKDYPLWFEVGRQILQGERVYPVGQSFPFMYPPAAAILLAPLSCFGFFPMLLALVALNSAAWAASVWLAVYLATGSAKPRNPWVYFLPTVSAVPFAFDTYHLGQPNLLLLALMLGSFACLRTGKEWAAGALVTLAAAIKVFPILAVGYLLYRRHWRALASVGVSLVALFAVVPVMVRGPAQGTEDVAVWARGMLFKYDADAIGQRTERAYSWKNQSLVGLANRLLRHKQADENDATYFVNVAALDFRVTNAIIATIGLGLCLTYIAAIPRSSARTPHTDSTEQAMLLLLILVFSPYAFGYFFVWLLYPFAVLGQAWRTASPGSLSARAWAVVLIVAAGLLASSLVWQRTVETYGNFFLTSLLLFMAFAVRLWSLRRANQAANAAYPEAVAGEMQAAAA